ncbi:DUF3311 domain-containing protein [Bacillus sp. B190/17]|uniref:DUF3311 domain-containing protein n=1 Tax=Bacillus lumedeiriae TaxID=3058829 RepID=A0ABW8IC54_9BACI
MKRIIILLSIIPFIGSLVVLPLINKIDAYVLGMPFLFFWVTIWTVLISGFLWLIYKLDPSNLEDVDE